MEGNGDLGADLQCEKKDDQLFVLHNNYRPDD